MFVGLMNGNNNREVSLGSLSRREVLRRCGMGMGSVALAGLAGRPISQAAESSLNPLIPKSPHFHQRAKRVIHIFANGGPSQVDTFDHKPMLTKISWQNTAGRASEDRAEDGYGDEVTFRVS